MKTKQTIGIIIAAAVFVLVGIAGVASASNLRSTLSGFNTLSSQVSTPEPSDNLALVYIENEIGADSTDTFGNPVGYSQTRVLDLIEDMKNSDSNVGLMLYVNSPGGAVYQSDEVYRALIDYKQQTGRPVYAYTTELMASGAYYIGCGADRIAANRNGQVGSIGVYIGTTNMKGLYDKLGIKPTYIKSGRNKAMGNGYDELTEEQTAIYQSLVDEYYDEFINIVCEARGYDRARAIEIADGRVYSAKQALANGLIDEIATYDEFSAECMELCGAQNIYERTYDDGNYFTSLFSSLSSLIPQNETAAALEYITESNREVPMYYAG